MFCALHTVQYILPKQHVVFSGRGLKPQRRWWPGFQYSIPSAILLLLCCGERYEYDDCTVVFVFTGSRRRPGVGELAIDLEVCGNHVVVVSVSALWTLLTDSDNSA
jgi:hypothetical protein